LSPDNPRPVVHVVAGAVIDAAGRVLIAQRPKGKHLAGGWEFPGGKLEPGEERVAGLARELHEDLGITIGAPRPLIRVRHSYPSREVLLDVWIVRDYSGEPRGLDDQELRWCTQDELSTVNLLPADWPIVKALRLPDRLTKISSPHYSIDDLGSLRRATVGVQASRDTRLQGVLCANIKSGVAAVDADADFIVLSEVLSLGELAEFCQSVSIPVYSRGLVLEQAWALGVSGINAIDPRSK
jgi:mutator protein MutT